MERRGERIFALEHFLALQLPVFVYDLFLQSYSRGERSSATRKKFGIFDGVC
jgi:hypothetical protein